jgi:hypothetical protein
MTKLADPIADMLALASVIGEVYGQVDNAAQTT